MTIYLALTPDRRVPLRSALPAHVAWAIDAQGALARSAPAEAVRGGLMALSDRCAGPLPEPDALCRAVARECAAQRCRGVLADFDAPVHPDRLTFLEALAARLTGENRTLYVPQSYAVPRARVLICTAVSGGTLREHLTDAIARFGAQRLALDAQRLAMDFTLPSPRGEGRPLSPAALYALRGRHRAAVFWSGELCARYFTCREGAETHFVLFDDADSLRRKLRLGESLGVREAFFMLPEVEDLWPELL